MLFPEWEPAPGWLRVRSYERVRLGRRELIPAHWRPLPRQLRLPL